MFLRLRQRKNIVIQFPQKAIRLADGREQIMVTVRENASMKARFKAGVDYPRDETEFWRMFDPRKEHTAFLERLRPWPDSRRCPTHGCRLSERFGTGRVRCTATRCTYEETLTTGTVLEGTPIHFQWWLAATWYLSQSGPEGYSEHDLAEILNLDPGDAKSLLISLRRAMAAGNERMPLTQPTRIDATLVLTRERVVPVVMLVQGRFWFAKVKAFAGHEGFSPEGLEVMKILPASDLLSIRMNRALQHRFKRSCDPSMPIREVQGFLDDFAFFMNHRMERPRGFTFHVLLKLALTTPLPESPRRNRRKPPGTPRKKRQKPTPSTGTSILMAED